MLFLIIRLLKFPLPLKSCNLVRSNQLSSNYKKRTVMHAKITDFSEMENMLSVKSDMSDGIT